VPVDPLPVTLRDDFDHGINTDIWPQVYGADTTNVCGAVVSAQALTFYKVCAKLPAYLPASVR